MLSRMNSFLRLSRFRSQIYLNKSNILFWNSFCSMSEPLEVDNSTPISESHVLPNWVKSGDSLLEESEDDDFVLPLLKFWIENHKISTQSDVPKIHMTDMVGADVHRICGMLKDKHFESVSSVILALNEFSSINVTEDMLQQILERLCFDWILSVGSFRWVEPQMGCICSPTMYNLMISNLCKARKFDVMWEFVEEMKQLAGYVSLDRMLIVMRWFAKAGKHEEALRVFRMLETYRVPKNIQVLNSLLATLSKNRGMEVAESVYLEFNDVLAPTVETFNILIHGWCRLRNIPKAEKVLMEMKKHGFEADIITYTSFIEAYCREKDFRKVDATMEDMQRNGLKPTVVTYTIIIKALGRAKEIKKSLDVYEKAKENGCTPDASLYTALITNLSKSGRLNDARELFEDMVNQGVAPDRIAYNAMIAAAVNHSREEKALTLLKRMEESSECKPDISTYSPLRKLCCRLKRMKVLNFLLKHMFKNNVSLDLGCYALLINRLCMNGSTERACAFFEELVKRGFVPTTVMYVKLVEWLEKNGMNEEKDSIEKLMQEAISVNSETRPPEVI